jgi:hypothetical protein
VTTLVAIAIVIGVGSPDRLIRGMSATELAAAGARRAGSGTERILDPARGPLERPNRSEIFGPRALRAARPQPR